MCEDRPEVRSPYADYSRGRLPSGGGDGGRHRERSRSPIHQHPALKREDVYSASLRLASLETLTGGKHGMRHHPSEAVAHHEPASNGLPAEAQPKVPISLPADVTNNPLSSMLTMPGSPFAQLLNNGGAAVSGLTGLPKPSDLLQHAQALQLLAHLQTMLLSPGQQQQHQTNLHNIDMQKVIINIVLL